MVSKKQASTSGQAGRVLKKKRSSKRSLSTASTKTADYAVKRRVALNRTVHKNTVVKAPSVVGNVFVFGTGETGQLGLTDDMLERKRPMPLAALKESEIVDIACGGMHSVALSKQGQMWSWGCNDHFALGRTGDEYSPARVENLDHVKVVKTVCSDSLTMALSEDGHLYCWGTFRSGDGVLGFSPTQHTQEKPDIFKPLQNMVIADIAAGADHCLALTTDGRVLVWGNSQQYQLGRYVPSRFLKNSLRPEVLNLRNIKLIGCGSYHSFAVTKDNILYAWGLNNFQQCGIDDSHQNASSKCITRPSVVTSITGKGLIKSVHGGNHHSIVLMEDGTVYAFGRADSGQLGLSLEIIEKLEIRENEEDDASSGFKKAVGIPTRIEHLEGIQDIAVGIDHSIALDASGKAYSWGFGDSYALGNGGNEDEIVPYKISGQKLDGHQVLRVAAGAHHSLLLASFS